MGRPLNPVAGPRRFGGEYKLTVACLVIALAGLTEPGLLFAQPPDTTGPSVVS